MALKINGEYARNGADNGKVVNPGEPHVACVVLLDTSGSMSPYTSELIRGIEAMQKALKEDALARGSVDVCIIAFDDSARIIHPFTSIDKMFVPEINCGGNTAMHSAVAYAINELKARIKQYESLQVPQKRHWIFLLTVGHPTDTDNGEFDKLRDYQNRYLCTFYPMAVGNNADIDLLGSLNVANHMVLQASQEDFAGAFQWLSISLSQVSPSVSGVDITLTDPNDNDYGTQVNVLTCGV